jgi:hypothetical protein
MRTTKSYTRLYQIVLQVDATLWDIGLIQGQCRSSLSVWNLSIYEFTPHLVLGNLSSWLHLYLLHYFHELTFTGNYVNEQTFYNIIFKDQPGNIFFMCVP